jgi:hypothetical protein
MRAHVKSRLAPSRLKQREPINRTTEVVNLHYTTAIIGGNQAGPVHGWEAIKPKRSYKPDYLTRAQAAVQEAWSGYLWLIDNKPEAYAAQQEAWERYDQAKRECDQAWEAYNDGFEFEPIPF